MPFTLVHPAAVLPLARTPLVPSALVLGSVAPDLPYYVSLRWLGGDYNLTLTHSASSVLWLDPLIALVLLAAFHGLVKRPLVALLSPEVAARVRPAVEGFVWRTPQAVAWIVASVVIGAATHLGWDAANDALGWAWSTRLNLLGDVVGALVLLGWARHWWRTTSPTAPEPERSPAEGVRAALLVAIVVLPVVWGVLRVARTAAQVSADLQLYGGYSRSAVAEHLVRELAVQTGSALVLAVAVYAGAWQLTRLVRGGTRVAA